MRRRALLARDACDRLLPSTASISSTRVSFALGEIASRAHGLFRIPWPPPNLKSCLRRFDDRAPGGFTPPWWLWWNDACVSSSFDPVPCLSRLRDVPACESLRSGPHIATAPRALSAKSVKTSPLCVLARLPSSGAFHRLESCDPHRARRGRGPIARACQAPLVLPPTGRTLRFFARTIPRCLCKRGGSI